MGKKRHKLLEPTNGCNNQITSLTSRLEDTSKDCCKKSNSSRIPRSFSAIKKISQSSDKKYSAAINQKQAFRIVLAFTTIAIYLNSLKADFVYDDRRAILENSDVVGPHTLDSWFRLFANDFWGTPIGHSGSHKSYRPLVTLSFKLQTFIGQQLGGNGVASVSGYAQQNEQMATKKPVTSHQRVTPSGFSFHLMNLVLHLYVVDLVFLLSSRLIYICKIEQLALARGEPQQEAPTNVLSCLASLLFACHPIHVEAVTSLVGRAELMGTLFGLLSFKSLTEHLQLTASEPASGYCNNNNTRCSYSYSYNLAKCIAFATLACLSKENCGLSVITINLMLVAWLKLVSRRTGGAFLRLGKDKGSSSSRNVTLATSFLLNLALLVAFIAFRIQLSLHPKSSSTVAQDDNFLSTASSRILPKFSHLDNPLALDAIQFCYHYPRDLPSTHQSVPLTEMSNSTNETVTGKLLDTICTNHKVLSQIQRWQLQTRLYLPIFNLKLLIWPNQLSYDWPLASIGLVKSPLELRFILALGVYLLLFAFLAKWLSKLLLIDTKSCTGFRLFPSFKRICFAFMSVEQQQRQQQQQQLVDNQPKRSDSPASGNSCSSEIGSESESETSSVRSVDTIKSNDSGYAGSINTIGKRKQHSQCEGQLELDLPKQKCLPEEGKVFNPTGNFQNQLNSDLVGWSLIWLVVPYLPASNLLVNVGFLVAERTLYLPSFGLCLLIAILFNHLSLVCGNQKEVSLPLMSSSSSVHSCCSILGQIKAVLRFKAIPSSAQASTTAKLALIFPLLILGALKSIQRNHEWRNELSLFTSNLDTARAKSLGNLATLASSKVSSSSREQLYRSALELEPYSPDLHYNLALVLHQRAMQSVDRSAAGGQTKTSSLTDPVEYHYKLALELRKNFPLAALNLAAYQYTSLNQLELALETYENCAIQMKAEEMKTFHQHVRIQIECLISGTKLRLERSRQTNGNPTGTEQTQPAVDRSGELDLKLKRKRQSSNSWPTTDLNTILGGEAETGKVSNGFDIEKSFEWLDLAERLVESLRIDSYELVSADECADPRFGDLNKQAATIHWLRWQCYNSKSESYNMDKQADSLQSAVEFALASQVTIPASIYTSFLLLLPIGSSKRAELLHRALEAEKRKLCWLNERDKNDTLAELERTLSYEATTVEEAMERMELALRMSPNRTDFLSRTGQLAYELGQHVRAEQLYKRALDALIAQTAWMGNKDNYYSVRRGEESSIEIGRKLASAYVNYGAILQVRGFSEFARAQYRRALDCDPNNQAAKSNLARLR